MSFNGITYIKQCMGGAIDEGNPPNGLEPLITFDNETRRK